MTRKMTDTIPKTIDGLRLVTHFPFRISPMKSSTFPILLMPYFLFGIRRLIRISLLMWNNELCVQHHNFAPKLSQYMIPEDFILTTVQSNVLFMHEKKLFSIYGSGSWPAGSSGTETERMCMWTNFFFFVSGTCKKIVDDYAFRMLV